jgi:hypothetical protein
LTDPVVARQLKHAVRQLQFTKAENEQLRSRLPERIVLTPRERRRLIRLGKPLGSAIKDLITIVTPATFQRWLREAKVGKEPGKGGRRYATTPRARGIVSSAGGSWLPPDFSE